MPTDKEIWESNDIYSINSLSDTQVVNMGFKSRIELQALSAQNPGSYWYIFGEVNRYHSITGERFAPIFHYYSSNILQGDNTAKIIGPSILNWDTLVLVVEEFMLVEQPTYLASNVVNNGSMTSCQHTKHCMGRSRILMHGPLTYTL